MCTPSHCTGPPVALALSYNLTLSIIWPPYFTFQYVFSFSQRTKFYASLSQPYRPPTDSQLCTPGLHSHSWCVLLISHCLTSPTQLSTLISSIKIIHECFLIYPSCFHLVLPTVFISRFHLYPKNHLYPKKNKNCEYTFLVRLQVNWG